MRIGFSSSCAIGLAIALTLGAVSSADAQQRDTTHRTRRRATSAQRIPISKERPSTTSPGEVTQPAPTPTPTVNQDSIAAVERARQDSIAAAERARQEEMARVEQMRRDSIAAAERRRQDSIAAVERARQQTDRSACWWLAGKVCACSLRCSRCQFSIRFLKTQRIRRCGDTSATARGARGPQSGAGSPQCTQE